MCKDFTFFCKKNAAMTFMGLNRTISIYYTTILVRFYICNCNKNASKRGSWIGKMPFKNLFFILQVVSRRTLSCMRSMDRLSWCRAVHYVPLCGHGDTPPSVLSAMTRERPSGVQYECPQACLSRPVLLHIQCRGSSGYSHGRGHLLQSQGARGWCHRCDVHNNGRNTARTFLCRRLWGFQYWRVCCTC